MPELVSRACLLQYTNGHRGVCCKGKCWSYPAECRLNSRFSTIGAARQLSKPQPLLATLRSSFRMIAPHFPDRIHVLTLTPFFPIEGDDAQGCFIAEPLPWLEEAGIRNTVLAVQPFYRRRTLANPGFPAHWKRFFTFPGGWGLSSAGALLFASVLSWVRRLHRQSPIHLIHAHAALPCGHAAGLLSRALKVPFVVTVHGLDAYFTNQVSGMAGTWCRHVAQRVYSKAGRVICISERVRERVLEGGQASTVIVYNGVDPGKFVPSRESSGTTILSVGNLIPIKGHELLLRGLAAVSHRFPQVSCHIIGDGPERQRLELLAGELNLSDKITFLGRRSRDQVSAAMQNCSVFALPSRYEGLGCVYLEAMACEKAVIACREQGIEEIVNHRFNGWLIQPNDLSGMVEALSELLQEPHMRRQIGEAARKTILERLTYAHQSQTLADLYRECVNSAGRV